MLIAELKWVDYNVPTRDDASLIILKPAYCLNLTLAIGAKDESGSDFFYTNIFNLGMIQREKLLMINKGIVIDLYTLDEIENHLKAIINKISGETWNDIVVQLKEYFDWEYQQFVNTPRQRESPDMCLNLPKIDKPKLLMKIVKIIIK